MMNLAVLLLSCKQNGEVDKRVTAYGRDWVEKMMAHVADYYRAQSGGRENLTYRVFDWFELSFDSVEWIKRADKVGEDVEKEFEEKRMIDLSSFDYVALVIDITQAGSGARFGRYVHLGAQHLTPALIEHELGHFCGARHAGLNTTAGILEYGDPFCIMGAEGSKYSYEHVMSVNKIPGEKFPTATLLPSGPGMSAPALYAASWLDLPSIGIDVSKPLSSGKRITTVDLGSLTGAPPPGTIGRVCAYADGIVPGFRFMLTYRVRQGWDRKLPGSSPGWVVAHLWGPVDGVYKAVQAGAFEAIPGTTNTTSNGGVKISIEEVTDSLVRVKLQAVAVVSSVANISVVAWAPDRLDIVGLGHDKRVYHKAWAGGWHPSQKGWELLGGEFRSPPTIASWGEGRLDIFGIGKKEWMEMKHKAWSVTWEPTGLIWDSLGGTFISAPVACSWEPIRLDVFAVATDRQLWTKGHHGGWHPAPPGWEPLGGQFINPPAVCSWGPNRIDVVGVNLDGDLLHKAWDGAWQPSQTTWNMLGSGFAGTPAICSWGPGRLDIFATLRDGSLLHKAWDKGWHPAAKSWEAVGGQFVGAPAATSWGVGRLGIFGVGLDGHMYYKGWDGGWHPSQKGWEDLGGDFSSPPVVASWAPGRLDVFGRGRDGRIFHKAWDGGWYPSQKDWEDLDGDFR